ncbi:MAG: phosphatidylserine/phosphatidylglycerophosphate/cardiolipin synthase family protein [Planctomycetes bacterium]|nr:phosphatidylserine/phosphatidylglycerophosphate/cardiolipin synthase family protein [Planctomycetota bacterium]
MIPRIIPKRARSRDLEALLQMLFIAELLEPSQQLWVVSPWLSDVPVIDNRTGVLSRYSARWGEVHVRLLEVLHELAERGTEVRIVTQEHESNYEFLRAARRLSEGLTGRGCVSVQIDTVLHTKGILGDSFWMAGSMNLTAWGVQRNDEQVTLHVGPPLDLVVSQRSHFAQVYGARP